MKYFSKSNLGFYDSVIHGSNIPPDAKQIADAAYAQLMEAQSAGKVIQSDGTGKPVAVDPPGPTPAQREAAGKAIIQAHMDAQARLRGYDDIKSAALRAAFPGPYHDEGVAFATWMDECWYAGYGILSDVLTGKKAEPSAAELIALLPELSLPARN